MSAKAISTQLWFHTLLCIDVYQHWLHPAVQVDYKVDITGNSDRFQM